MLCVLQQRDCLFFLQRETKKKHIQYDWEETGTGVMQEEFVNDRSCHVCRGSRSRGMTAEGVCGCKSNGSQGAAYASRTGSSLAPPKDSEALPLPGPHHQGSASLPLFSMLDKGKQKQTQPYPDETPPLLGSPNSKTLGTHPAPVSPVQLAQDEQVAGPSTAPHLGQYRTPMEDECEGVLDDAPLPVVGPGEHIPTSESAGRDMQGSAPNTDLQRSSRVDGSPRSQIWYPVQLD